MRAGSRSGCERMTRPSAPRARTIAWRPRKRIVASAPNTGGWVRASGTAVGSLALAVGVDRRPNRTSALVMPRRAPERVAIRLPTDTRPPRGLGVVCRTPPTSFRGALVRAVARAYRGTPSTTPAVGWTPVMPRLEPRKGTDERLLVRKLSRHDDQAAIAEMRDGAARQQTMRRDPVIPPHDAAAQAEYGFGDDLDVLQLDCGSNAHGALLFGVRAEHTWQGRDRLPSSRCGAVNGLARNPMWDPTPTQPTVRGDHAPDALLLGPFRSKVRRLSDSLACQSACQFGGCALIVARSAGQIALRGSGRARTECIRVRSDHVRPARTPKGESCAWRKTTPTAWCRFRMSGSCGSETRASGFPACTSAGSFGAPVTAASCSFEGIRRETWGLVGYDQGRKRVFPTC